MTDGGLSLRSLVVQVCRRFSPKLCCLESNVREDGTFRMTVCCLSDRALFLVLRVLVFLVSASGSRDRGARSLGD